jgi:hypothetical protein
VTIDFSQVCPTESLIQFPDSAFTATPKQPSEVKETVYITGGNVTGASVTGTSDNPDY